MNFKNAILTILTFTIAIQFVPPDSTYKSGLPQFSEKTPPTTLELPTIDEQPTKEYFIKPPIGTAWSYQAGQCVWGVATWTAVPAGLSNANQWDDRARAMGYEVTKVPAIGAVAVSNAGYYGHVELVTDKTATMVKTKGMNVRGPYTVVESWKPYGYFDWYIYF